MKTASALFQGIMKLKTLCVGGDFARVLEDQVAPGEFPNNVLGHAEDFSFFTASDFETALDLVLRDQDIDLVFFDADYDTLSEMTMFITQLREIRPQLPVVIFTFEADDNMRYLMRTGATWHFCKYELSIRNLLEQIHRHVFAPVAWDEVFEHYASDAVRPRIEPGLSYHDLEALNQHPEERYIIKRLFANSDVVQIFRMDEGFSGSRIYTVKPTHQLKRILKIEVADQLAAVKEKQERLVQPRLNRQVGQIQGKTVRGQHLAGACYTLAGSNRDATTLSLFLQDQNRVRKDLVDLMLEQLQDSLEHLYAGSSDSELRYWAPLYSRILPTSLTLENAVLVDGDQQEADFVLSSAEISTLSSVPSNSTLADISAAVRRGEQPAVILRDFEVAEVNTREGVLYLHDDLIARFPVPPLLTGKDHPILRFKVRLQESERVMLSHPVFRPGKRVAIRGTVVDTQEQLLARNIEAITGQTYDCEAATFELAGGYFISPTANVRHLLWEIGREDMIVPIPHVAPVIHGDLNTSNLLVEDGPDVPVWLIDFSDARAGHVFFDLAKLEVELRTHVFYRLFMELVNEGIWDEETAFKFALLVESLLLQAGEDKTFEEFVSDLRDYRTEWYDALYTHFPLYFENLLYFLFKIRSVARAISPERFDYHYPVALFFHAISVLKYEGLERQRTHPWPKRLALCCAVSAGKQAVEAVRRPNEVSHVLNQLRQRSAFAIVCVGKDDDRKYLMQWNNNWQMFNLVGGKINNEKGDRESFARAIQRELHEELGLRSPKDYRIVRELQPVIRQQFSRRQHIFKDYEFRLFQVEFLPRHPQNDEEFERFAQRFSPDRENVLLSRSEIERLRTREGRPISETTLLILQELGEIGPLDDRDFLSLLDLELETRHLVVSRGRARLGARIVNPRFGSRVENVLIEVLPSPFFQVEADSVVTQVDTLKPGQEHALEIWLQPREKKATLTIRATCYDARGNEFRQIIEKPIEFEAQVRSLFHIDNPYVVGKPLTSASESLYVGREDVFSWIEENLLGKTQPHTLILFGQRRMGKTSTLYQLVDGQRGKTVREYPGHPIYPVYVDLQRLASTNTSQFFEQMAKLIVRQLQKRGISVELKAENDFNGHSYAMFDAFLDQVEAKLPEQGLLVIIMDEFEQLQESVEKGRINEDILPYLRSLMQHRARMTFILAGTNQLVEDYWSIIFHVGISREITALSREETEKLIRNPVLPAISYDELAVDQIWLATRGHPYFTQLLCHRLVSSVNLEGRRSKLFTVNDVREAITKTVEEDDSHLQYLWNQCTPAEQFVLAALVGAGAAVDENVSRAEIAARLVDAPYNQDDVRQALKQLELKRLVTRQPVERQIATRLPRPADWQPALVSKDYAYTPSFDLLHRWIAYKHPLGSLLHARDLN